MKFHRAYFYREGKASGPGIGSSIQGIFSEGKI